jgi:hypothetical protein
MGQRLVQRFFDLIGVAGGDLCPVPSVCPLALDPLLLGGQDLLRHDASIVQMQELLLLPLKTSQALRVPSGGSFSSG